MRGKRIYQDVGTLQISMDERRFKAMKESHPTSNIQANLQFHGPGNRLFFIVDIRIEISIFYEFHYYCKGVE